MLIPHGLAGKGNGLDFLLFDNDTQFFVQLANQRGFRCFLWFNLASGEFPEAGHRLAFRSLLYQNSAILVDESSGSDKQICRIFCHFFVRCKDFVNPFL